MKNPKVVFFLSLITFCFSAFFNTPDITAGTEAQKTNYFRVGGTVYNSSVAFAQDPRDSSYTDYFVYRFTFVDKYGNKITNTNSADISFEGRTPPWSIGGTYYNDFKFGTSNTNTVRYKLGTDDSDEEKFKCSADATCMNNIFNAVRGKKVNGINYKDLMEIILAKTGNTKHEQGEFLIVEKIYHIDVISEGTIEHPTKAQVCTEKKYEGLKQKILLGDGQIDMSDYCYKIDNGKPDEASNQTAAAYIEYDLIRYVGTGMKLLNVIKNLDGGQKIGGGYLFGDPTAYTGLYFLKNNVTLQSFSTELSIFDSSELKDLTNNGFEKIKTLGTNTACSFNANYSTNFDCLTDVTKGYGLDVFFLTSGEVVNDQICKLKSDADNLGRKWNSNGYCCLGGQTSSSCFTHDSVSNNDLNYTCQAQMNLCAGGGVNSILRSFLSGTDNGGKTLSATNSGECILNNSMYSYGNGIYCYETLSVSFSNVLNGISSPIPSGSFISIGKPATIVSRACYKKYNDKESKEPQFEKFINEVANLFNEKTGPDLSMNLFGNHSFKSNTKKVESTNVSLSIGDGDYIYTTSYGTNYMKATLSTAYTYNYSDGIYLNKFVDMKTATGSLNRTTAVDTGSYKTLIGDTNVSVPTDVTNYVTITEDGKKLVPVTYTIDGLQNLQVLDDFANLTSTKKTSYQYKKSDDCGGTCVVTYNNSNIGTAEKCSNEYNYLEKLYENSYDIKTTKNAIAANSCNFQFSFKTNSKAECDRAKGDGKGTYYQHGSAVLYSSYSKDASCYDYLNFNNTNTGGTLNNNNSCSTKIEIEDPPYDKLVFRPIDLSKPFPGKDGKGRDSGSNWSDSDIETYISDRQDAYTKKPMYSFTLTPARIKKIREDNKNHSYDEFNLNCRGKGSECFSVFVATYRNYMNKEKSSCYFETAEERTIKSFNSCADYSKR